MRSDAEGFNKGWILAAPCLLLPLLMAEVIRLGREDRGRQAALIRAAAQPNRLTVAPTRGGVPIRDVPAIVGADDYDELLLANGRRVLYAPRAWIGWRRSCRLASRASIANLAHAQGPERDGRRWRLILNGGEALLISRTRAARASKRAG